MWGASPWADLPWSDGPVAAISGAAVPAGVAADTSTALQLLGAQIRGAGLASETDAALALALAGAVAVAPVGLAVESGAALAMQGFQIRSAGLALEINVCFARPSMQLRAAGRANEAGAALALLSGVAAEEAYGRRDARSAARLSDYARPPQLLEIRRALQTGAMRQEQISGSGRSSPPAISRPRQ